MSRRIIFLLILGFLLSASSLTFVLRLALAQSYVNVSVQQAKAMIDSNPSLIILDVRNQSEYDAGHIRNAKLIPLWNLTQNLIS